MPYKLLLADDSVTIQRVIELTFADEDVAVTAVGDGQQAIEKILSDRPDIVLADVGMPKQDGYEVAAYIKAEPSLRHIPVLLLTGAFEPVDEARARSVNCDGVLAKPFEPQLLIGRVKELLKGVVPSAPAEPVAAAAPPAPVAAQPVEPATNRDGAFGIDVDEDATVKIARPVLTPLGGEPALDVESLDLRPEPASADNSTLDDYFDRLDAAFAHLTGGQPGRDAGQARTAPDPWTVAARSGAAWPQGESAPGLSSVDELDPDRRTPIVFGPGPDVGASSSPADDLEALAVGARPASTPPVAPAVPFAQVSVSDAFTALLLAEREHGPGAVREGRPGAAAVLLPGTAVTDAFVDEVARRVIERLGEPAFKDVVKDVVSAIAERLIREEIARIKALL
jgi:CheY-like chemotaxis protein